MNILKTLLFTSMINVFCINLEDFLDRAMDIVNAFDETQNRKDAKILVINKTLKLLSESVDISHPQDIYRNIKINLIAKIFVNSIKYHTIHTQVLNAAMNVLEEITELNSSSINLTKAILNQRPTNEQKARIKAKLESLEPASNPTAQEYLQSKAKLLSDLSLSQANLRYLTDKIREPNDYSTFLSKYPTQEEIDILHDFLFAIGSDEKATTGQRFNILNILVLHYRSMNKEAEYQQAKRILDNLFLAHFS